MTRRAVAVPGWLFTSLGLTLLGASILMVPGNAFADYTGQCTALNGTICPNDPTCPKKANECCGNFCGNLSCISQCCQDACGGKDGASKACYDACTAAVCPGNTACISGCAPQAGGLVCAVEDGTLCSQGTVGACVSCKCTATFVLMTLSSCDCK
jgi:hypothetical protein